MSIDPGSLILGTAIGFASGAGLLFVVALCMAAGQADERTQVLLEEWLEDEAERKRLDDESLLYTLAESQPSRWRAN